MTEEEFANRMKEIKKTHGDIKKLNKLGLNKDKKNDNEPVKREVNDINNWDEING
ncbi:hypothetical protein [Bacillus cereus]|uniref:hypothetical protein n=1 Tax=Bacillus cereus TaxID=1396 RepID=UPI0015C3E631|nr:hypothetical protein [Bacillus cereus]